MNKESVDKMKEVFMGKVCTILPKQSAFPFDFAQKQYLDYLVGKVEDITDEFIIISHLHTGLKSTFLHTGLIGILEEQTISNNHPDAKALKEHMLAEKAKQKPQKVATPFVDIKSLQKQAASLKK